MTSPSPNRSALSDASDALEVRLLGLVDFDSALQLQERLVYELSGRDDTRGLLLICEHPPIVTIGREGSRDQLACDPDELAKGRLQVRWLNRGGGCVVHGPGQLAAYPVLPLQRLGLGLAEYRRRLEEAVVNTCADLRVPVAPTCGAPVVSCRCGQFATLGIAVKSWIAYHGLFLNVSPDLGLLRMARWTDCGAPVTSLAAQRCRPTSMHSVRSSLVRHLISSLGYERYHVYTGHPLLRPKRIRVYDFA